MPTPREVAQQQAEAARVRAEALRERHRREGASEALAQALGPLALPLDEDLQRWFAFLPTDQVTPELVVLAQILRLLRGLTNGQGQRHAQVPGAAPAGPETGP